MKNWLRMRLVIYRSNRIIQHRNNDLSKLSWTGAIMGVAAVVTVLCINLTR